MLVFTEASIRDGDLISEFQAELGEACACGNAERWGVWFAPKGFVERSGGADARITCLVCGARGQRVEYDWGLESPGKKVSGGQGGEE